MSDIGYLECIAGCMFAGKTEELIRQLRRAVIAKKAIHVFKPVVDTRNGLDRTVSHSRLEIPATAVDDPTYILKSNSAHGTGTTDWVWDADVIGIDEAQFFDPRIVEVVDTLVSWGKQVIVAGLDLDYRAEPFGSMPVLIAKADHVTHLTAVCTICGQPAIRTQRLSDSRAEVEIGGADKYAARCRRHFDPGTGPHLTSLKGSGSVEV